MMRDEEVVRAVIEAVKVCGPYDLERLVTLVNATVLRDGGV